MTMSNKNLLPFQNAFIVATLILTILTANTNALLGRSAKIHGQCNAFISQSLSTTKVRQVKKTERMMSSDKESFLNTLDVTNTLNGATKERSAMMQKMIDNRLDIAVEKWSLAEGGSDVTATKSLENPGLKDSFNKVAPGNWKVIYAPHMTTIAGLFGGKLDVQYTLYPKEKMESHARYIFPIIGQGFLSVSGTYDSVDENISRVDFDKAWIKPLIEEDDEKPYKTLDDAPDGPLKEIINAVGKTMFIEQFSVFPVSFLDDNLIVFEFPLLGTRVCAMKQ
jgi:hypothetical protein